MRKSFEFIAGVLCLDFINTVHAYGAADPQDDLQTPEDLLSWAVAAKLLRPIEATLLVRQFRAHAALGRAVLRHARQIRARLRAIFKERRIRPQHLRMLNSMLSQQTAIPSVVANAGRLRVQWRAGTSRIHSLMFPILLSAADLMASKNADRIRECASSTCTFLFLDTSKNHSRRWCEMAMCGNRAKVADFRQRHRQSAGG